MLFVYIFIFILLLLFIVYFSHLKLNIYYFSKSNTENLKYFFSIGLYFFNKIPILKIKIDNKKVNNLYKHHLLKKINIKDVEKFAQNRKPNLKDIKKLDMKIEKLDLKLKLGIDDVILNSYLIAFISIILSNILPFFTKSNKNIKYSILPEYNNNPDYEHNPVFELNLLDSYYKHNKNYYKINLIGIFSIKIVNIISIIKKGRIDKSERTSNRRSYDYSYE